MSNWAKFTGTDWKNLLIDQPGLAKHCNWDKLNSNDWAFLLSKQPKFKSKREIK